MHETVKTAWMLAIEEMETGTLTHEGASLLLKQVEQGVTELERCMTQCEEGLAGWERIMDQANQNLGRLWVIQQEMAGRRDQKAKETRWECRDLAQRNLESVSTAKAWKATITEWATLGLQQMALLREAVNGLQGQDWPTAAECLRRHLTLEAKVEQIAVPRNAS